MHVFHPLCLLSLGDSSPSVDDDHDQTQHQHHSNLCRHRGGSSNRCLQKTKRIQYLSVKALRLLPDIAALIAKRRKDKVVEPAILNKSNPAIYILTGQIAGKVAVGVAAALTLSAGASLAYTVSTQSVSAAFSEAPISVEPCPSK